MDYEKITRDQMATYIDVAKNPTTPSWKLLGIGITGYGIAYNPQVTTEKWIINKNATSSLDGYQRQGDISQKCYKGDPVFEFVNEIRRNCSIGAQVQTQVLDIDRYDQANGAFKATKSDIIVTITNYMAEDAVIEYSIYYNGDPVVGTVTFTDEVPTFVEDTPSL